MNSMVQEVIKPEGNTTCNTSEFLSDFDLFVQEYTDFKKYVLNNINSVNEKLRGLSFRTSVGPLNPPNPPDSFLFARLVGFVGPPNQPALKLVGLVGFEFMKPTRSTESLSFRIHEINCGEAIMKLKKDMRSKKLFGAQQHGLCNYRINKHKIKLEENESQTN